MTIWGDSKEEDREIFAALKSDTMRRRQKRKADALKQLDKVKSLVDDGRVNIDQNGTWNMRIKGVACQYWPTKGRWQYTCPKLIAKAKEKQARSKAKHYSYYVSETQFGGGIHKFIHWLMRQQ